MKLSLVINSSLAAGFGWLASLWCLHRVETTSSPKILFYQSPMHPWVKSDQPGECTVCGMNLVPVYQGGVGFDKTVADLVILPEGNPNVFGVQTTEVKKRLLVHTLRVSGLISEDESRHGVISAPVEGRIDGLAINHDGQPISQRQPIATIFSQTLLSAADDYKLALDQGGPALYQAERRLQQYGLAREQIQAIPQRQPSDFHFGILSPLTGTIVKSYVNEGQFVRQGERLFEIADFTRMWFLFNAHEQDLPFLKERQVIHVTATSLPGKVINARIGSISPSLDEVTHTVRVRVVLENPERNLKNKSYAEGLITTEEPDVLALPRSAVLWPGATPIVFVQKQAGGYEQRTVKLGRAGDCDWEVINGLEEGERVVTQGNMLLDAQAQLNQFTSPSNR